jgi:hypothetical protein
METMAVEPGTRITFSRQGRQLIRFAENALRLGLLHGCRGRKPLTAYELKEELKLPPKTLRFQFLRLRRIYGAGYNMSRDEAELSTR